MKTVTLLQLAAAFTSAFVISKDQEVLNPHSNGFDNERKSSGQLPSREDLKKFLHNIEDSISDVSNELKNVVEAAVEDFSDASNGPADDFLSTHDLPYQQAQDAFEQVMDSAWSNMNEAFSPPKDAVHSIEEKLHDSYFEAHEWFTSATTDTSIHDFYENLFTTYCGHHGPGCPPGEEPSPPHHPPPDHERPPPGHDHPPGGPPPHHPPPGHDRPPGGPPPHHPPPGHDRPPGGPPPHHPPPGHEHPPHPPSPPPHRPERPIITNLTLYELLSESNYTTKFAKLIRNSPSLLKALNSTTGNYTVFAPLNGAFDKIPQNATEPSNHTIESILQYHISPDVYPAERILVGRTIPTLLQSKTLGGGGKRGQRIGTNLGFGGLTMNFYSKAVVVDIFGSNGVIHGIDSILLPFPKATEIINLLPLEFSTLELGLIKTGLFSQLNATKYQGGTVFAPTNLAFLELGHRANAFLFSNYGLKYLKALLQYHIAPASTLYSDILFTNKTNATTMGKADTSFPKGKYHFELPTMLQNKSLEIDVARWGRFIDITVNNFNKVILSDVITADGVLHLVSGILIPPKEGPGGVTSLLDSKNIEVDDLITALEPYVEHDNGY